MKDKKYLYAPQWQNLIWFSHSNSAFDKGMNLTEETKEALKQLLGELSHIACTRSDREGYWKMWFPVERGTIENFGNYEEMHQDGDYSSYDDFVKDWEESYPKEFYWHKLQVATENGYIIVQVDDGIIINVTPKTDEYAFERDVSDALLQLAGEVKKIRIMVEKGEYDSYLEKNFPYEYRYGTINRKKLWEIDPDFKKYDIEDLSEEEIQKFADNIATANDNNTVLKTMTAGRYYEICSYCYLAAKFKDADTMTPKQMYERFGDDRDGGLSTLPLDSEEEFEKWYNIDNQEKWKIQNPSHMWELYEGSSYTRIHLHLDHKDGFYHLTLSGGYHCRSAEIVRMFNAIKEHNIPVTLYYSEAICKKITGQDDVGIVPVTERPYSYWYGGFPVDNLLSFTSIEEYNTDIITKSAKWLELPTLKLAK